MNPRGFLVIPTKPQSLPRVSSKPHPAAGQRLQRRRIGQKVQECDREILSVLTETAPHEFLALRGAYEAADAGDGRDGRAGLLAGEEGEAEAGLGRGRVRDDGDDVEDVEGAFVGVGVAAGGDGAEGDEEAVVVVDFRDFEGGDVQGGDVFVGWQSVGGDDVRGTGVQEVEVVGAGLGAEEEAGFELVLGEVFLCGVEVDGDAGDEYVEVAVRVVA